MKWNIVFYNDNVASIIEGWPAGILAKYLHLAERIEIYGPNLGMPHTKAMKQGLFEMRLSGKEGIGRLLYMTKAKEVIILHAFIKKTQQTPKKDLEIAYKRLGEVVNEK
jgi:phage-related protein